MKVAQLLLGDLGWRFDQQILSALRLRKRDHVADRFNAAHQRNHSVKAERDSAMRWSAILQRVEQEAEFPALVFRCNA